MCLHADARPLSTTNTGWAPTSSPPRPPLTPRPGGSTPPRTPRPRAWYVPGGRAWPSKVCLITHARAFPTPTPHHTQTQTQQLQSSLRHAAAAAAAARNGRLSPRTAAARPQPQPYNQRAASQPTPQDLTAAVKGYQHALMDDPANKHVRAWLTGTGEGAWGGRGCDGVDCCV